MSKGGLEGTKIKRVSKMGPRGRKKVNWAKRRSNEVKSVKKVPPKGVKDSLTANVYRYTAHENLCFSIQPYFAAVLNCFSIIVLKISFGEIINTSVEIAKNCVIYI